MTQASSQTPNPSQAANRSTRSAEAPDRPNMLVIMSDQHSPHVLGSAGDPYVRTPHLDALASNAVAFNNTYCASPLCVPSRMSFLTGRHPSDINVWTNPCLLDPDTPTFAHALTLAGYDTVLCGRMHFAGVDQHHGFSRRLVGDVSGARDESQPLFENKIPRHTSGQDARSVRDAGPGRTSYIAFDDDVTRSARDYLRQRQNQQTAAPFCMVVGYLLPHNPYVCPLTLFEEYMERVDIPDVPAAELESLHPAMRQWREVRDVNSLTREEIRRARAAYYGLVTYLDQQIGQVLAALSESGLADDTIVVYTSDHGEMAGEHGMWWKESFYEASVKVPMLWSGRGLGQGTKIERPVSLLDVAPTLLAMGEAEPLPGCRGRSLLPLLMGASSTSSDDEPIFAEVMVRGVSAARMIRRGRWKLIYYHGFEHPQMFDLVTDPQEQHDLGQSQEHTAIREQLRAEVLDGWSGQRVTEETANREQAFALMRRWNSSAQPGESEVWRVPPGSNARDALSRISE